MKKICRVCGQEFETKNGRQQDCNRIVFRSCPVCGKEFEAKCSMNDKSVTCSKECRNKYASMQRQAAYSKQTKICELCGQEFHPRSNTQKVCEREHFSNCVVCGREFKLNYKSAIGQVDLRKTCSDDCLKKLNSENCVFKDPEMRKQIEATMISKYGVAHAAQDDKFKQKMKATMLDRYGVEHAMQSETFRDQIIQTNREKYGTDWAGQSEEVKEARKSAMQDKYGVDNPMQITEVKETFFENYKRKTGYDAPMQNPEVQQKSKETLLEKYGVEHISQTDEFKEKFKQTSLEKYGVENPMQSLDVQEKVKQTSLERYGATSYLASEVGVAATKKRIQEIYGVDSITQTAEWKLRAMRVCTNIDEWMKFTSDCKSYIKSHYSAKPTYHQLSKDLGTSVSTVCDFIYYHNARDLVSMSLSYMEEDVGQFLDSIEVKHHFHDRRIIAPLEIDIVLDDLNIGIECNPTVTHNCSIPFLNRKENLMSYSYHKTKSDKGDANNIFIFHIFGYDWTHNQEVIKSMIRNLTNKTENVIYARKCEIKEVPWNDSIEFLEANHRQGSSNAKIRLGLFFEDELVSLMTFNKMRSTIGTGKEDLSECWELARFCSKLNTTVVGGASKLFKHFIQLVDPKQIRSFSDRAHTKGNLYSQLGFKEIRRSDPGYVWVDTATDKAYNRVNAQKSNIVKFLNDESIDLSLSESQIMVEHGFVKVPDSGTITWEWRK